VPDTDCGEIQKTEVMIRTGLPGNWRSFYIIAIAENSETEILHKYNRDIR